MLREGLRGEFPAAFTFASTRMRRASQAHIRQRGVAAAIGLIAVVWIEQFWLGLPGRQTFCERSGISCDLLTLAWPGLWPQLLGIAVGLAGVKLVRQGPPGVAALAIGAGVFTLSFSIARIAFIPFLGASPVGDVAGAAINTIIGAQLVGALGAGVVLGHFGRRHILDALVLVVFFIGPWAPQLRIFADTPRPFMLSIDWPFFVPVGYAIVSTVGVLIGVGISRYRVRGAPAHSD